MARALLLTGSLCLLPSCSMLPVAVQTTAVTAMMDVTKEEVAAVMREASARHSLDAQWVARFEKDALEVGLGKTAASRSVVYRRVNGRWVEDPDIKIDWSNREYLGPPPPPALH